MKVCLIHDTSERENVGCKTSSGGLLHLLASHEVQSISAGHIMKLTAQVAERNWLPAAALRFLHVRFPNTVYKMARSVISRDRTLVDRIVRSEIVVLNGEGTLHDSRLTSLVLLSIARFAKEVGKDVYVVNATMHNLDAASLRTLSNADRVVVRDAASAQYLHSEGVACEEGADAAWIYLAKTVGVPPPRTRPSGKRRVLFTSGVAGMKVAEPCLLSAIRKKLSLVYLAVDQLDKQAPLRAVLRAHGIPIQSAEALYSQNPKKLFSFIKGFDYVVSGRHHINIFGYYMGVPVVPLPSNTHKVEGTVQSLQAQSTTDIRMPVAWDVLLQSVQISEADARAMVRRAARNGLMI